MNGIGRGCGNCSMELLLSFLKNPQYNVYPVFRFLQKEMMQLKNEGLVWGYDIPYLLTGKLNQHPSAAIAAMKEKRTDYARLYTELMDHE
jgi:4-hydroxy 2-oxovalerate aldolase